MSVTFNETVDQRLSFSGLSGGATIRNIRLCVDLTSSTDFSDALFFVSPTVAELSAVYLNYAGAFSSGKFEFFVFFSGNNGAWNPTNAVLNTTGYNEIFITYDGSSTANDPVFYVNGASVAVTERVAPTGTIDVDSSLDVTIGSGGAKTFNGKVLAVQYYTGRVVTAAEVADAYNSRLAIPNFNGLVFSPNLNGAAGLQTFDGATLSGTNYLKDTISGATGTPSGSPVGAADTYLNWK